MFAFIGVPFRIRRRFEDELAAMPLDWERLRPELDRRNQTHVEVLWQDIATNGLYRPHVVDITVDSHGFGGTPRDEDDAVETFVHEVGHLWDYGTLTGADRAGIRRLLGIPTGLGWPTHTVPWNQRPQEAFADQFARTMMGDRWTRRIRHDWHTTDHHQFLKLIGAHQTTPVDTPAEQVRRLYLATFLREPDPGGHGYWTDRLTRGIVDLVDVADLFAASSEFRNRYGYLDPAGFVALVYRNVLGRAPDAAGLAFWVGRLGTGWSRGQVIVGFSESAEFIRSTTRVAA